MKVSKGQSQPLVADIRLFNSRHGSKFIIFVPGFDCVSGGWVTSLYPPHHRGIGYLEDWSLKGPNVIVPSDIAWLSLGNILLILAYCGLVVEIQPLNCYKLIFCSLSNVNRGQTSLAKADLSACRFLRCGPIWVMTFVRQTRVVLYPNQCFFLCFSFLLWW